MDSTEDKVISIARGLLRPRVLFTPYGRTPSEGLDCIGVVLWVGKGAGLLPEALEIPPYSYPPALEAFGLFEEYMVRLAGPERGAVAILILDGLSPRHTGVVEYSDDKWKIIGVDTAAGRPWVTITPLDLDRVWRYYAFKTGR